MRTLALAIVGFLALTGPGQAKSLAVLTDGNFDEWAGKKPRINDPAGDGAANSVDLRRLWIADDGSALFLRLEVGRETLLQNSLAEPIGNSLRLFLDLDGKKKTGLPLDALGVELEIRFGARQVLRYDEGGSASPESPGAGAYLALSTFSSNAFEIRVELPPAEKALDAQTAKRRKLKLLLRDETAGGDRLPNGGVLKYKLGKKPVEAPEPIEAGVPRGDNLRIISFNVEDTSMAREPEAHTRFLEALQPDVINYQELAEWSPQRVLDFVNGVLPGKTWSAAQVNDVVTVSAFPIRDAAAIDGNMVAYIDLPNRFGSRDLVVFNAHTPCCGNDAQRDEEVDHLMQTWRDLLAGSGPFAIGPDDAMVLLGDFNLVGYRRQYHTLRDGIFSIPSNGPDFSPGRAQGSLLEAPLRHTHERKVQTWRRTTSEFSPGRLDYLFYTGDALEHRKSFVPDTAGMPKDYLDEVGFEERDSQVMSDHLPLVADFAVRD